MASINIFIFFGLLALGFLIPSEVAATNIGTKSSPGRDEAITNPVIILVAGADQNLNQSNIQDHKFITFNVDSESYEDLIQKIRDELNHSDVHGIPVLAPQQTPETPANTEWLDIRLVADDRSITVRLQQSNLYVRGYSRSTDDFFWEFSDRKLIAGSKNISFSGSYVEADGMERKSPVKRKKLKLGKQQLRQAVLGLAKLEDPHGTNTPIAAKSLLVLVQMIAEAARYRAIAEHIFNNYDGGVLLDSRMLAMEKGWDRLSTAMLRMDINPIPSTPLPNIPDDNPTQVYTLAHALAAIGILLLTVPREGSTITMMNVDYGRSLMNIEYVRINNINGEDPGNLFGTVVVDDGWYTYTFYDRSSGDYENVGPGGFATLTDPSQSFAVSGADAFIVSVDLFDHDSLLHNDEIAQGEIVWDSMIERVTFENYNKHLQQMVKGEYGDVTVGYSVLSNALSVTIQVQLIDCDGESTAMVYGTLRASQVLGGSVRSAPITLFDKSSKEYEEVRQWDPIPINREVIAASTSTKLTITADLWDYDPLSPDYGIAQGSVDFTVRPGKQSQYINGLCGQVNVFITCE